MIYLRIPIKLFVCLLLISISFKVKAYPVQILHTNDIHSYFENTDHDKTRGGYANLKYLIDKYKASAFSKGVETLVLDAGDFMEGNIFYMANYGLKSFNMHNLIGYDFSVVGNHDFLMGTKGLDELLGKTELGFTYLSANISTDDKFLNINKKIRPYKIITMGGYKIAIMGLTTSNVIYSWRLEKSKVSNPIKRGKKIAKKLKRDFGVDAVIALTHIGLKQDKKLAKAAYDIDLIVGGHSHHALAQPVYQDSKYGHSIPIVQAGQHAEYLGKMLIDVTKQGIKILSYKLIPVHDSIFADQEVLELVEQSYLDLYDIYGEGFLHEEISVSYLDPKDPESVEIWSYFTAESMKESVKAQISIQQDSISGPNYPVGVITHFDLFNAHPRWFEFSHIFGWKVYKVKVCGFFLKTLFRISMNFGLPLSIAGITFEWYKNSWGRYRVKKLRIGGKRIKPFKRYTVALPEGFVRGGFAISPLVGLIFKKSERTLVDIFNAIKEKLKREGGIGNDYIIRKNYIQNLLNLPPIDRIYFPGDAR